MYQNNLLSRLKISITSIFVLLLMNGCNPEDNQFNSMSQPAIQKSSSETIQSLEGIEYASVTELSEMIEKKGVSSQAIVKYLLKRIDNLDKHGPQVNSIIEINPDALSIAIQMDKERLQGKVRGPLHGIPILIKDNIDTADQMQTTAGSTAMLGEPALKDAFLIQKLRAAGAIIIAKNNLSEWANFRAYNLPNGWSSRGGQTKNPHLLTADTCGSSAGSAASVSAGFAPLSVGTETTGSIICPAMRNGVVGMRPTLGLISRSGIIPITSALDTAGALGRNVKDVALLLTVISGTDPLDLESSDASRYLVDYDIYLKESALVGKRIGYVKQDALLSPNYAKSIATLSKQGAILVELDQYPFNLSVLRNTFKIMRWNFKRELNAYLQTRAGLKVKSIADISDYNFKNPTTINGKIASQQAIIDAEKTEIDPQTYQRTYDAFKQNARQSIDDLINEHQLDAIVEFDTFTMSAPAAGYPGISIPSGMYKNLPSAVYFYGPRWSDAKLLSIAYSFEQASKAFQKPAFLKDSTSENSTMIK